MRRRFFNNFHKICVLSSLLITPCAMKKLGNIIKLICFDCCSCAFGFCELLAVVMPGEHQRLTEHRNLHTETPGSCHWQRKNSMMTQVKKLGGSFIIEESTSSRGNEGF
jgi:hypothetical protein